MKYNYTVPPPNVHNTEELLQWLQGELLEIEAALDVPEHSRIQLVTLHAAPSKPREGDIVRADGTDWDPGLGEGVYEYTAGGAWSKL